MSTRHLIETDVDLVIDQIKSAIGPALLAVGVMQNAENPNYALTVEAPRDYYVYPKAMGYRTPAVFVIGDRIDFQKREKGANHINANVRINVTVLVEDKDAERITRKAYRYQAALHECLDQVSLTSSDDKVKIVVVIQNAAFSPLYSNTDDPNAPGAVFRKEVALELDCYHYESF